MPAEPARRPRRGGAAPRRGFSGAERLQEERRGPVIANRPGWEGLGDLVSRAAALANTAASDPLDHVLVGYSRFRRYTPRMLRMLDIEASPVAQPLLEAVDVLRSDGTARPTGFLRPNSKWSRRLRAQADARLWETAVLFHLRDAFRAGDVWLARSRSYGDIRRTLLAIPAVPDADRSLPVPARPRDWLAERQLALADGLRRLAAKGTASFSGVRQASDVGVRAVADDQSATWRARATDADAARTSASVRRSPEFIPRYRYAQLVQPRQASVLQGRCITRAVTSWPL